ncbi:IS1380 family transposase [Paractinoplanes hotanensis]|uniref:IS1380 family transposase n=1 Tax=Paractinoplanes hotanensis TaxID=2906497 RepID=A0ABT0YEX0_9ACTN|nr:IS1380 family transposase [Actinoplanes hotanensis]MCM4084345.1 IS1380 family transposase [Actinoplanes hotanensis]
MTATGKNLVGHAGAVLLRKCADKAGLTSGLNAVIPRGEGPGWWDRGTVLTSLAVSIGLGATSMSDIDLLAHQAPVFGDPPSDCTVRRCLAALDTVTLGKIGKARAKARRRVWDLIADRPGGFPWLLVAGKLLHGWIVIDLDATLITAHSDKQGAAVTFKKGFGFHPLGAWCANTAESLAMLLREGNAGSNTVSDHIRVLADAIEQIPARYRRKILVRVDGAGATHDFIEHLHAMNSAFRTVRFTVGWTITEVDEAAIAVLPADAWIHSLRQNGEATATAGVAELTGLDTRAEKWLPGLRLTVRRTKPAAQHRKNLTDLERKTGWRYAIVATNITRMWGIAGSHHPQWLDALHRSHAGVEDQVRVGKALGPRNLPSKSWTVNRGWVLAANIAADITAWTRLLGLHDQPDLADAEPETLRYRLLHLPATLSSHARQRVLKIPETWPWTTAFINAGNA